MLTHAHSLVYYDIICGMKQSRQTSHRIPRVIAVVSMQSNFGPSVLRGVFAHISASGEWSLSIVRTPSEFTDECARQAIAHKVSGFIFAFNDEPPSSRTIAESNIPFVTVETYSPALDLRALDAVHVRIDNEAIGRDAARSFISQGRYASFGYVLPPQAHIWAKQRGEGFANEVSRRERQMSIFSYVAPDDSITRRGELAKWLRRLAKPAAVLAADDATALEVLQACKSARLAVPSEISVMGVDDEEMICENTVPSLTSLRPDFVRAGERAAAALERMMRCRTTPRTTDFIVVSGENEIVRRASTVAESSAGTLVQKALAFIERNAKHGIGVKDVQAHLRVSRPLLDLRFRQVKGESVLTCILAARLKELKRLLSETDDPIESITRRLGWDSPNYPKNLFKKRFGMSMREWRISHAIADIIPGSLIV